MTTLQPAHAPGAEKRAARRWACLIVGFLVLQVVLCSVGITLAIRGKNHEIEPDYYYKAVHWDQLHKPSAAPAAAPAEQTIAP